MRRKAKARIELHTRPISGIDIRPIAVFTTILAALGFLWNVSQERTHALLVHLPQGWPNPEEAASVPYIIVEITASGERLVDGELVSLVDLKDAIKAGGGNNPTVLFQPHASVDYGTAAITLNEIVKAGVSPTEICFHELEKHRLFEKAQFYPATTIITDKEQSWEGYSSTFDLPLSGCDQFYQQSYPVI